MKPLPLNTIFANLKLLEQNKPELRPQAVCLRAWLALMAKDAFKDQIWTLWMTSWESILRESNCHGLVELPASSNSVIHENDYRDSNQEFVIHISDRGFFPFAQVASIDRELNGINLNRSDQTTDHLSLVQGNYIKVNDRIEDSRKLARIVVVIDEGRTQRVYSLPLRSARLKLQDRLCSKAN